MTVPVAALMYLFGELGLLFGTDTAVNVNDFVGDAILLVLNLLIVRDLSEHIDLIGIFCSRA